MTSRFHQLITTLALASAGLATAACTGATQVEGTLVYDYPAVYVDPPPDYVYYEPRVYYRGRYAYLVDDRWYYPTDRGWVVFREEPRELQRYRVSRHPAYDYRYRSVPDQRRYETPDYGYRTPDYRYRTPEYGTPAPLPPPRYRPSPAPPPRLETPPAPAPPPRYRTPAPPPPAQYRHAPRPQPAPPPAPRAPAPPPPSMPKLVPAPHAPPPPAPPPPRTPPPPRAR
jgi:hypothetical protein